MTNNVPVITIDGPSGVGKGTVSLRVAQQLGWHTLDSGAMYRVLALAAQQHNIALEDETALVELALQLSVDFKVLSDLTGLQILLEGQEVSVALRAETCGMAASKIAVFPAVRQALLERQRAFCQLPGLVAEGRDMGTVVFNHAPFKFFLTASPEERAQRRYKQLKEKGISAKLSHLLKEIEERDKRDRTRAIAPLMAADDAMIIDTTAVSIERVVACILKRVSTDTHSCN